MVNPSPECRAVQPGRYRYVIMLIGFATLAGASGVSNAFAVFYSTLLKVFDWSCPVGAPRVGPNRGYSFLALPVDKKAT